MPLRGPPSFEHIGDLRRFARQTRRPATAVSALGDCRWLAVSGNERTQALTDPSRYTSTIVERSGPAIRAALLAYAPAEECEQFEAELRAALERAREDLDLTGPQAVLTHWHAMATMAANPPTDEERELVQRAKAGDYAGLSTLDETGNWIQL